MAITNKFFGSDLNLFLPHEGVDGFGFFELRVGIDFPKAIEYVARLDILLFVKIDRKHFSSGHASKHQY
jgi:hypothetical protein